MSSELSLMQGKCGLVLGVANDHSIAWGIASAVAEHGAELAFTYQGEGFSKRVKPLAKSVGSNIVLPCDVSDDASIEAVFSAVEKDWGSLDFGSTRWLIPIKRSCPAATLVPAGTILN